MNIENRLKELGVKLPEMPPKGGVYTPLGGISGNDEKLFYVSGCGPNFGEDMMAGKLGIDSMIYISQLLQSQAIKYGVEHWRGRCMGAIYC